MQRIFRARPRRPSKAASNALKSIFAPFPAEFRVALSMRKDSQWPNCVDRTPENPGSDAAFRSYGGWSGGRSAGRSGRPGCPKFWEGGNTLSGQVRTEFGVKAWKEWAPATVLAASGRPQKGRGQEKCAFVAGGKLWNRCTLVSLKV